MSFRNLPSASFRRAPLGLALLSVLSLASPLALADTVDAGGAAANMEIPSVPEENAAKMPAETGDSLDNYINNFYQNINKP